MAASFPEYAQRLIEQSGSLAFLIDFDGTLVDLVSDPDDVHVPDELLSTIDTLNNADACPFAIVTGRSIGKLDHFLQTVLTTAVGSHGAECRSKPAAQTEILAPPFPIAIRDKLREVGNKHDCIFEDKTYSLSLHSSFEHTEKNLLPEILSALDRQAGNFLTRKIGRTYDVMWRDVSKGSGIVHLMKHPAFIGRKPIYIGDDANIDESLQVVTESGGELFSVRSPHGSPVGEKNAFFEVQDVKQLLDALACRNRR